jgi:hypothetical protein
MKYLLIALLLVSCGSDKDNSSDEPISMYGIWAQNGDCGYVIDIEEAQFFLFHVCYTYKNEYQTSFKTVKFDNDEGILSGAIIGSTCEGEIGTKFSIEHKIEGNKMSIGDDKGMIGNLIKQDNAEPNNNNDALTIIYGCNQSGSFKPTQIYK